MLHVSAEEHLSFEQSWHCNGEKLRMFELWSDDGGYVCFSEKASDSDSEDESESENDNQPNNDLNGDKDGSNADSVSNDCCKKQNFDGDSHSPDDDRSDNSNSS